MTFDILNFVLLLSMWFSSQKIVISGIYKNYFLGSFFIGLLFWFFLYNESLNINMYIFFKCFVVFIYFINLCLSTFILKLLKNKTTFTVYYKFPHIKYPPSETGKNLIDIDRYYHYSIWEILYSFHIIIFPFALWVIGLKNS
jgi:hypothetical protein